MNKIYVVVFLQRALNAVGGLAFALATTLLYDYEVASEIYFQYSISLFFLVCEAGLPLMIVQRVSSNPKAIKKYASHYLSAISLLSFLMFLVLLISGLYFYKNIDGLLSWILLALFVPLLMVRSAIQNFHEGNKQLYKVAIERLFQAVLGYSLMLLLLLVKLGLWAIPGFYIAMVFSPFVLKIFYPMNLTLKGLGLVNGINWLGFTLKYFKKDRDWQVRLILQSASTYFSNQFWIVALAWLGYVKMIPIIAFLHQIVFSVAGFSALLFSVQFAHLSEAFSFDKKDKFYSLIVSLLKKSIALFLFLFLFSIVFYGLLPFIYDDFKEKVGAIGFVWPYALSCLCIYVSSVVMTIENSKGYDRFLSMHLVKITGPFLVFAFVFLFGLGNYIPVLFLFYWVLVILLVVAIMLCRRGVINEG